MNEYAIQAARRAHAWAESAATTIDLVRIANAADCERAVGSDEACVARDVVAAVYTQLSPHDPHIAHMRLVLATAAGVLTLKDGSDDYSDDGILEALRELPWTDALDHANREAVENHG